MTMFRTFKPVKLVAGIATILAVMLAAATPYRRRTSEHREGRVYRGRWRR
jgi:hypothetical protein